MLVSKFRFTPGSLDLSGSRFKQGELTPSPPESPIGSNADLDQRPNSCEDDMDFHRVTPPKLPKSNHLPFIGNNQNIARVEPLPPPTNTNSKFLGEDLDMLEELKARAKAALLKEGGNHQDDMPRPSKIDDTFELMKTTRADMNHKRAHEDAKIGVSMDDKERSEPDIQDEDSENQPLSKRLRTKSISLEEENAHKDIIPVNDPDISSPAKVNKNPFDDEEDEEEEDDQTKNSKGKEKEVLCEDEA